MNWLLSWTCYWLGDFASRIMVQADENEQWVAIWYPVYNFFMCHSSRIQDRGGVGKTWPWEDYHTTED